MQIARIIVALVCAMFAGNLAAAERPNILLLVAEDLGSRIGAFGDRLSVTPNIDALAATGTLYTNVFTTAGVCAPSRAAMMTGVHQNALGAGHMRSYNGPDGEYMAVPPAEVKAFPELLRAAGYFTYVNTKLDYQFSREFPGSGPFTIWDLESRSELGASWRDRDAGKPFFGMYNFMETHESGLFPRCCWPRSMTQLVMGLYQARLHWDTADVVQPEQVAVPPYYPDTLSIRRDIARQYNNVITMDRVVGDILQQLEQDGLADDTIVIWTTDHGDGLPRAKRELYDSGLKVPLVIRWPERFRPAGVAPGGVDTRLVSFVDLAPTILSLAGAPIPGFMQGRLFAGATAAPPREYIYAAADRMDELPDRQRAVRDRRFKYIRNYHPELAGAKHLAFRDNLDSMQELWRAEQAGELNVVQRRWFEPHPPEELYDIESDPDEIHNLAEDPAYGPQLVRMRAALAAWQRQVVDLGAIPEAELAQRFWPDGRQPVTAAPRIEFADDGATVVITATTPGASTGYRINGGPWALYTGPVAIGVGGGITAKSVRYGWAESDEVGLAPVGD